MRLVLENTEEDANGFGEDPAVHGNCLRTGSAFTAIARCFGRAALDTVGRGVMVNGCTLKSRAVIKEASIAV
jgi:hypothetical protein